MTDTASDTSTTGIALQQVVEIFRESLAIVKARAHGDLKVNLVSADLSLKVESKTASGIGGSGKILWVIPVGAGTSSEQVKTQELTLSLVPNAGTGDLGRPETEELAQAIIELARAAVDIKRRVASDFDLTNFGISADVGVSRQGKLQLVAGREDASGTSHRISLKFRMR